MKKINSIQIFFLIIVILGCSNSETLPKTLGDADNAETYGYQPIDPLPVSLFVDTGGSNMAFLGDKVKVSNKRIMANLPDETMRLAIRQIDGSGNISFSSAKMGVAGHSYEIILDYIKFDTQSLPVELAKDSLIIS